MRNTILRILYAAGVFLAVFILMEVFTGGSSTQTTGKMSSPVLPVVSMQSGGLTFNPLHGYTQEQDAGSMRPPLTPVSSDRSFSISIDPYEASVISVTAQARNITGERLIEEQETDLSSDEEGLLHAGFSFSNLIDAETEYILILILQIQQGSGTENEVRYYTRFVCLNEGDDLQEAEDALSFAQTFHDHTFDKTSQDDLLTWLEPDTSQSDNTLQTVTLHSSTDQVTWGDLDPVQLTDPVYSITDIENGIYGIRGTFRIRTEPSESDGTDSVRTFGVVEYFELRKGTDRFYLMDYERTMTQNFDPESPEEADGELDLGIVDPAFSAVRSSDRGTMAFVLDGNLYSVQNSARMLAYIYGFREDNSGDEREEYAAHDIRIERVSDDGSIDFIVYGYMNAGSHEGKTGVVFYHYSGSHHTLEEKVFIPVNEGWERLQYRVEQESYYNEEEGCLYLILEDGLYEIDVDACSIRLIEGSLAGRNAVVSESGQMVACEEEEDGEETGRVVLRNLAAGTQQAISAEDGKTAVPLGFIGEDLIYGTRNPADMVRDSAGISLEPIDHIYIVDADLHVLEDYSREGYYVTGVKVEEGQITLTRVQRSGGTCSYTAAPDDQIVSGSAEQTVSYAGTSYDSRYQTTVRLEIGDAEISSLRYIRPEEILFEGSRELEARSEDGETDGSCYVYDCGGLLDRDYSIAGAIAEADASSTGIVVDGSGRYLWRGSCPERSEIDSLTVIEDGTALRDSLTVCLEAMLSVENVRADLEGLTGKDESAAEILQSQMPEARVLELTGCSMEEVLYYVGLHHAVCAMQGNGNAVLIVGYGPDNVELYDPAAGSVYLLNRDTAQTRFRTAGNRFITYVASR